MGFVRIRQLILHRVSRFLVIHMLIYPRNASPAHVGEERRNSRLSGDDALIQKHCCHTICHIIGAKGSASVIKKPYNRALVG